MDTMRLLIIITSLLGLGNFTAEHAAKWSPWRHVPMSCQRLCSEPLGMGEYARNCLLCQNGTNCNITEATRCQGASTKKSPCNEDEQCTGAGLYTGRMSPWLRDKSCPPPWQPCTGRLGILTRYCMPPHDKTDEKGTFKCSGENITEKIEPCSCEMKDDRLAFGSQLSDYGSWKEWSDWDCARPCEITVTRTRQCFKREPHQLHCLQDTEGTMEAETCPCHINNRPVCQKEWSPWSSWTECKGPPHWRSRRTHTRKRTCLGYGEECTGEDNETVACPSNLYWKGWYPWTTWTSCSVSCDSGQVRHRERKCNERRQGCRGEAQQTELCPLDVKTCVSVIPRVRRSAERIDGGWSEWSTWNCARVCGAAKKFRRRLCNSPRPQAGGSSCPGPAKTMMKGCKFLPCPKWKSGAIAAHVKSMIDLTLKAGNKQHKADQGKSIALACDNKATKNLMVGYKPAEKKWLHNGVPVTSDPGHIELKTKALKITNLNVADNGVYLCQVEHSNGPPVTTTIYTLIVKPNVGTNVAGGSNLGLDCYGDSLALLFPGMRQMWIHNGVATSSVQQPFSTEKKYLMNIGQSMAGIWKCEMTDPDTNRMWVTNRVDIVVSGEAQPGNPSSQASDTEIVDINQASSSQGFDTNQSPNSDSFGIDQSPSSEAGGFNEAPSSQEAVPGNEPAFDTFDMDDDSESQLMEITGGTGSDNAAPTSLETSNPEAQKLLGDGQTPNPAEAESSSGVIIAMVAVVVLVVVGVLVYYKVNKKKSDEDEPNTEDKSKTPLADDDNKGSDNDQKRGRDKSRDGKGRDKNRRDTNRSRHDMRKQGDRPQRGRRENNRSNNCAELSDASQQSSGYDEELAGSMVGVHEMFITGHCAQHRQNDHPRQPKGPQSAAQPNISHTHHPSAHNRSTDRQLKTQTNPNMDGTSIGATPASQLHTPKARTARTRAGTPVKEETQKLNTFGEHNGYGSNLNIDNLP